MVAPGTFTAQFRKARGERTLESIARQIGVSNSTVDQWNSGVMEPNGRNLVRLAEALGREPAWFFEDEEVAA